jgi:hypothetical protein
MPTINDGSTVHNGPDGSGVFPDKYLDTLKRAIAIIQNRIRGHKDCEDSFADLPGNDGSGGRTFSDMWNDFTIWLNYDPDNGGSEWGWTEPDLYPNDVVITQFTLRMGRWSTAGTIIHEMAHLNGAPGGDSKAAETTLKH